IGRDTFIDFDIELDPNMARFERESRLEALRTALGGIDGAVRAARALPAPIRGQSLAPIGSNLARRGDAAGAMGLAASVEAPDAGGPTASARPASPTLGPGNDARRARPTRPGRGHATGCRGPRRRDVSARVVPQGDSGGKAHLRTSIIRPSFGRHSNLSGRST